MIRKFLDISNAHVSKEARDWLNEQAAENHEDGGYPGCWHVASHVFGWWLRAAEPDDAHEGFPESLLPVCAHAKAAGCDFILLDADAEVIDGLPVYDWEKGE
jgi:hypothetical protein